VQFPTTICCITRNSENQEVANEQWTIKLASSQRSVPRARGWTRTHWAPGWCVDRKHFFIVFLSYS
jgi:hypothetical protein